MHTYMYIISWGKEITSWFRWNIFLSFLASIESHCNFMQFDLIYARGFCSSGIAFCWHYLHSKNYCLPRNWKMILTISLKAYLFFKLQRIWSSYASFENLTIKETCGEVEDCKITISVNEKDFITYAFEKHSWTKVSVCAIKVEFYFLPAIRLLPSCKLFWWVFLF